MILKLQSLVLVLIILLNLHLKLLKEAVSPSTIAQLSAWKKCSFSYSEINGDALDNHQGIIANPNCSSAVALMALFPLHKRFGLRRFIASTYQAVSGAGALGPICLDREISEKNGIVFEGNTSESVFAHPIAYNLIPHIDQFRDDGYTKEELKMRNESRKILELSELEVSCTCVRVPVYRAHSICINAEFHQTVNIPDARQVLNSFEGLDFVDDPKNKIYPMPINCSEKKTVRWGDCESIMPSKMA